MINELIFISQALFLFACTLVALRFDKALLIAFIALQAVLANMFVIKQITLFGLGSTCSEVFIVSSMIGITLLQEYYGEKTSKQALYISFAAAVFYLLATQFHLAYIPSYFDNTNQSFKHIFAFTPRIIISSIIVYFFSQRLNILLYKLISKIFPNKISLCSFLSISLSQAFDTVLFAIFALYGIVHSVTSIIIVSISIKILVIILSVPAVKLSKYFINKKDKIYV